MQGNHSSSWARTSLLVAVALLGLTGTAAALPGRGSVDAGDLQRGAVRSTAIKDGQVRTRDLARRAVTASRLRDGAVRSATIDDGAITSEDVAEDTLTAEDLATGSVEARELGADAVGSGEVLDDALRARDLAPDSVGASELGADAVASGSVAPDALGAGDLAPDAVAGSEVQDRSLDAADVGHASGVTMLDFPALPAGGCVNRNIDANVPLTGDPVFATPAPGFPVGLSVHTQASNIADSFRVIACNPSNAASANPGPVPFAWIVFDG